MTQKVNKEYAIHKEKGYILVKNADKQFIVDEFGVIIIPNAENGWNDLLDYLREAERCSNK